MAHKHVRGKKLGPWNYEPLNILRLVNPKRIKAIDLWIEAHESVFADKRNGGKADYPAEISNGSFSINVPDEGIEYGPDEPTERFPMFIPREYIGNCLADNPRWCEGACTIVFRLSPIVDPENRPEVYKTFILIHQRRDISREDLLHRLKGKHDRASEFIRTNFFPGKTLKMRPSFDAIQTIRQNDREVVRKTPDANPMFELCPLRPCNTHHGMYRNNTVTRMIKKLRETGALRRNCTAGSGRGRKKGLEAHPTPMDLRALFGRIREVYPNLQIPASVPTQAHSEHIAG